MTVSISVFSWFMYYAGFYLLQILLAWYTLGSFRWETLTLSVVSFPIYVKALFNVLTGRDVGWQATGTARGGSPFNFVVPQMLFFLFLSLTSVVAIFRDVSNGVATLATAWNITNTVILGAFLIAVARDARLLRRGIAGSGTASAEPAPEPRTVVARPTDIRETQPEPQLDPTASSPLPSRLKESVR
jgi:cellulose synthase (UDP-forming)